MGDHLTLTIESEDECLFEDHPVNATIMPYPDVVINISADMSMKSSESLSDVNSAIETLTIKSQVSPEPCSPCVDTEPLVNETALLYPQGNITCNESSRATFSVVKDEYATLLQETTARYNNDNLDDEEDNINVVLNNKYMYDSSGLATSHFSGTTATQEDCNANDKHGNINTQNMCTAQMGTKLYSHMSTLTMENLNILQENALNGHSYDSNNILYVPVTVNNITYRDIKWLPCPIKTSDDMKEKLMPYIIPWVYNAKDNLTDSISNINSVYMNSSAFKYVPLLKTTCKKFLAITASYSSAPPANGATSHAPTYRHTPGSYHRGRQQHGQSHSNMTHESTMSQDGKGKRAQYNGGSSSYMICTGGIVSLCIAYCEVVNDIVQIRDIANMKLMNYSRCTCFGDPIKLLMKTDIDYAFIYINNPAVINALKSDIFPWSVLIHNIRTKVVNLYGTMLFNTKIPQCKTLCPNYRIHTNACSWCILLIMLFNLGTKEYMAQSLIVPQSTEPVSKCNTASQAMGTGCSTASAAAQSTHYDNSAQSWDNAHDQHTTYPQRPQRNQPYSHPGYQSRYSHNTASYRSKRSRGGTRQRVSQWNRRHDTSRDSGPQTTSQSYSDPYNTSAGYSSSYSSYNTNTDPLFHSSHNYGEPAYGHDPHDGTNLYNVNGSQYYSHDHCYNEGDFNQPQSLPQPLMPFASNTDNLYTARGLYDTPVHSHSMLKYHKYTPQRQYADNGSLGHRYRNTDYTYQKYFANKGKHPQSPRAVSHVNTKGKWKRQQYRSHNRQYSDTTRKLNSQVANVTQVPSYAFLKNASLPATNSILYNSRSTLNYIFDAHQRSTQLNISSPLSILQCTNTFVLQTLVNFQYGMLLSPNTPNDNSSNIPITTKECVHGAIVLDGMNLDYDAIYHAPIQSLDYGTSAPHMNEPDDTDVRYTNAQMPPVPNCKEPVNIVELKNDIDMVDVKMAVEDPPGQV